MKNVLINNINKQEYFISVVSTKKYSSMLAVLTKQEMGDRREINLEAFIYEADTLDKIFDTTKPEALLNEFKKTKPIMTIWLGEKENSKITTLDIFQNQMNDLLTKVDLSSDKDVIAKFNQVNYEASIHYISSIFWPSKIRGVYILKNQDHG